MMNVVAINRGEVDQGQLRPPSLVMRSRRLGASHPNRLSFARILLRRMHRDGWSVRRDHFQLDENGAGSALYVVEAPAADLAFFCMTELPDDTESPYPAISAVLYDGIPTPDEIERLKGVMRGRRLGRFSASDCIFMRAECSAPLFGEGVARLVEGDQPDIRNVSRRASFLTITELLSNGKNGLSDFDRTARIPGFAAPFQAEMLATYLLREFSIDLVEHFAWCIAGSDAAKLSSQTGKDVGVSLKAGLNYASYLVKHPILLDRWTVARETAIARVTGLATVTKGEIRQFRTLLDRACMYVRAWKTSEEGFNEELDRLLEDLNMLREQIATLGTHWWRSPQPWARLVDWIERNCGIEAQEIANSLILEPYPELVDNLVPLMRAREEIGVDPTASLSVLLDLIERHFGWALAIDFTDPRTEHYIWYISEGSLETRRGVRGVIDGQHKEQRLGIAREIVRLHTCILEAEHLDADVTSVADFLSEFPDYRYAVRRVQTTALYPYGEIRVNSLHVETEALRLVRGCLSFLGATGMDPQSSDHAEAVLFQGAPTADRIGYDVNDWIFSVPGALDATATEAVDKSGAHIVAPVKTD